MVSSASGGSDKESVGLMASFGDERPFFREVIPRMTSITTGLSPKSVRDVNVNTGAAQGTLQDIKRPEACGGYTYADSGDISTRNRFVYWRVNHDVLELSELSLDVDINGGHVCVRFQGTPVLDGVSVHEFTNSSGDINVVVLVATVSSVHRIVLPHPQRLDANTSTTYKQTGSTRYSVPSIFADLTAAVMLREPSSYHVLNLNAAATSPAPHTSACWLSASGEAHFAIASGASVLHVRLPPNRQVDVSAGADVTVTELRKSNVIRRVLTGVFPTVMRGGVSSQAQDAPLSLCFDASTPQLLFTLCRDCHVRVWSVDDRQCLIERDLLPFVTYNHSSMASRLLLTGQRHVLKKSLRSGFGKTTGDGCLLLVAALHVAERRCFVILKFEKDEASQEYDLDYVTTHDVGHMHNLIDFALSSTHMWALWSTSQIETVLSYTAVGISEPRSSSGWKNAILQSTESRDVHFSHFLRVDAREEYCKHIFYPGRFSFNTISKAIFNTFRRSADLSHASDLGGSTVAILREEVTVAVETELQNCASEYEVADDVYVQLQQECWAKFYSGCLQFHQVEMEPMGIFVDVNTELVYYIKKSSVSVLRPCDFVEMFSTLCDGSNMVPLDLSLAPSFTEASVVHDLIVLFKCLAEIRSKYSANLKIVDFKDDLYHLVCPEKISGTVVDGILEATCSDSKKPRQSVHVVKKLKDLIQTAKGHLPSAVEALLDAIDLTPLSTSRDSDFALDVPEEGNSQQWDYLSWSHQNLFGSMMGASLLAESVQQLAEARFDVCRDLLVLLTILTQAATEAGLTSDVAEELHSRFMPRTCLLTQAYFVVTWICETVATTVSSDTIDESIRHLGLLNLSDAPQPCRVCDFDSSRLIEIFVRNEGGSVARSHLSRANILSATDGRLWTNTFAPLVSLLLEQVWPITVNCLFMDCLLRNHQYVHIQEYDRLLRPWCEWNSCSRKFACGYSHLVQGRPHAAVDWFQAAADGALHEEFIASKLGVADADPSQLVVIFYCMCIRLLEQFQHAEHVILMGKKAIHVAGKGSSHLPTLWTLLFKYFLELGRYEDAFAAMLANPENSRKVTCLRQFVIVLFERRQLKTLIEFSYNDLDDEVVEIMEQRARTIDLNVHNYYELLYSFHVVRGNFRRAGSMMYEYGMRLGGEVGGVQGLQRQAKCYLAAMNALGIVDPNYAWLVKPLHASPSVLSTQAGATSPKRSYDGEELPPYHGLRHQVALVELKDIRLEYELVLARLQLIKRDHDLVIGQGPGYTAEETVIHLSKAGLFDKAIHICKTFSLPMQPVFETLVNKCVHLTRAITCDPSSIAEAWDWLVDNEIPGLRQAQGNNVCDHAWLLLKSYLEQQEEKGQIVLHKCAAIRILSLGSRPPNWLLATYKTRDVADLLRVYLRFRLLDDAARLSLEYIDAVLGEGKEYFGLKTGLEVGAPSVWMPFTSIDTLLEILDHNPSDLVLASLKDALKEKLVKYLHKVELASKRMLETTTSSYFEIGKPVQ